VTVDKQYSIEATLKELGKEIKDMTDQMQKEALAEVPILAAAVHSLIREKAQKLRSTRPLYMKALNVKELINTPTNSVWAVTLDQSADFIETGRPAYNAIESILNGGKPAKVSKDGHRYKIIPFEHSGGASTKSLAQNKLADMVKMQLKAKGLDKIITTGKGKNKQPLFGKVVKNLDLNGPLSNMGNNILAGVNIYQKSIKNKAGEHVKTKRDVMTFRVISDSQSSPRWDMPARKGLNAFDEVAAKLDALWENHIKKILGSV
jgi:hypothetical protein